MDDRNITWSELVPLTEAYYGKSDTLLKAENVLGSLLEDMKVNPLRDYTNDSRSLELSKLLCKQFGFKNVHIVWTRTPKAAPNLLTFFSADVITNASTDPIRLALSPDKKTGFYDKNHNHVCVIQASSTMPAQMPLSKGEYLSLLLHEIGHNFDKSPYMALSVALFAANTIQTMLRGNTVTTFDPMTGLPYSYQTGPTTQSMVQGAVQLGITTNPGKDAYFGFKQIIEKFLDGIPILKKFAYLMNNALSSLQKGVEMFFSALGLGVNIMALPVYLLLSPVVHLIAVPTRKSEVFADSFATVYGYGPELASSLEKLESANMLKYNVNNFNSDPALVKIMKDMAMANRYILQMFMMPSHGTNASRFDSMIRRLEEDLSEAKYPAQVEREIRAQIDSLKQMYDVYMTNGNSEQKLVISVFVRNMIKKIFGKNPDFVAKLFPDIKFN